MSWETAVESLGRILILVGVFIVAVGVLFLLLGRLPFLGRLPGDFSLERPGFSLYLPLATSIVLSIALTVALNIVLRVFHK